MKRSLFTIKYFLPVLLFVLSTPYSNGQDPTKVDSSHYKTLLENDKVRVLRITYGPREKSVMHYHPDAVAIFLSDSKYRMHHPKGETADAGGKAGEVLWTPATTHLPENLGEKSSEVILIELKPAGKKAK